MTQGRHTMLAMHKQVQPLTEREMEAFGRAIAPPEDPFQAWLSEEIFTKPCVPFWHRAAGVAGFVTGGVGGLVTFYLAEDLMKIFGVHGAVKPFVGFLVIVPRVLLGGNAVQDCVMGGLHDYFQKHPLPRKNNRPWLRKFSNTFVYISSAALGLMGVYILWNNLPYNRALRGFFLPSILLGNGIVNVRPFLDANNNFFARYSQGMTPQIREKRAALIDALRVALNEIRAYDAATFDDFYEAMTARMFNSNDMQQRWDALLDLAHDPKQIMPPPKSAWIKARGYFGWLLSFLSSLTNIQISYAQAKWLADALNIQDAHFIDSFGFISSVLCVAAYDVLCAGPTQEVFENQKVKRGWNPSHPWLRETCKVIGAIFGFASAIPNASWPIVLGETDYEKSLAGPAFISPGSLYWAACLIFLNRLIDCYDRWKGDAKVIDYIDFLTKLEMLPCVVAQLPDENIDKMLSSEHPLLMKYRASHLSREDKNMVESSAHLNGP